MHAIIRTGNGKYYTSAIFGSYIDGIKRDWFKRYYIVLDESKTKLVIQPGFDPKKSPFLDQLVLFFDEDDTDWVYEENGDGNVSFLPKKELMKYVKSGDVPEDILQRCKEIDTSIVFHDTVELQNEKDIERLMMISGCFHDACISDMKQLADGALEVSFDGFWGCVIKMKFSGDVSCCTDSRNPVKYDPYWMGATLMKRDGYFYFVDDEEEIKEINNEYCWFKAKKVTYQVIPK